MSSEQDFIVDMVSSLVEDTPNEEQLTELQERVTAMSPDELRKFFLSSLERLSCLNQSQALFHSLVDPNSDKCLDVFKHLSNTQAFAVISKCHKALIQETVLEMINVNVAMLTFGGVSIEDQREASARLKESSLQEARKKMRESGFSEEDIEKFMVDPRKNLREMLFSALQGGDA